MSRNHDNGDEMPQLYSIHKGQVQSIKDYGAFVRIQGFRKEGLVHISQLANYRVENCQEVLNNAREVWVKVISLENDKISLSMKVVNQDNGQDLDAANENVSSRNRGNSKNSKINLGAVYHNAKCENCGGQGHLKYECKQPKSNHPYSLIPEPSSQSQNQSSSSSYNNYNNNSSRRNNNNHHNNQSSKYGSYSRSSNSSNHSNSNVMAGGRGKEINKPAWMVKQEQEQQKMKNDDNLSSKRDDDGRFDDDERRNHHKKKKKDKKRKKMRRRSSFSESSFENSENSSEDYHKKKKKRSKKSSKKKKRRKRSLSS